MKEVLAYYRPQIEASDILDRLQLNEAVLWSVPIGKKNIDNGYQLFRFDGVSEGHHGEI